MQAGDKVRVAFPRHAIGIMPRMRNFQGKVMYIAEAFTEHQYTLEGCKADSGKPYWFLEDWLELLEEGAKDETDGTDNAVSE